jgi:hypothetical protein
MDTPDSISTITPGSIVSVTPSATVIGSATVKGLSEMLQVVVEVISELTVVCPSVVEVKNKITAMVQKESFVVFIIRFLIELTFRYRRKMPVGLAVQGFCVVDII